MGVDAKLLTEILSRLDVIGAKMQQGAGYVWQALIKRAIAEGVADLLLMVIMGVIGLAAWKYSERKVAETEDEDFHLIKFASVVVAVIAIVAGYRHRSH